MGRKRGRRRNELAVLIDYRLLLWKYFSVFSNISLNIIVAKQIINILSQYFIWNMNPHIWSKNPPICPVFSPFSLICYLVSFLLEPRDRKIKKESRVKCDLGASMECKLISEHFIRSDYWHIYPTFFFYFSSVVNELNSNYLFPFSCKITKEYL